MFVTLPRVPAYKFNTTAHTGPFSGPSSVCTPLSCHALFTFNQLSDGLQDRFKKKKKKADAAEGAGLKHT